MWRKLKRNEKKEVNKNIQGLLILNRIFTVLLSLASLLIFGGCVIRTPTINIKTRIIVGLILLFVLCLVIWEAIKAEQMLTEENADYRARQATICALHSEGSGQFATVILSNTNNVKLTGRLKQPNKFKYCLQDAVVVLANPGNLEYSQNNIIIPIEKEKINNV